MNRYLSAAAAAASIALLSQGCEKKSAPAVPAGTAAPSSSTTTPTTPTTPNRASPTANTVGTPVAGEVTPLDQSEASADIKTTADIRRAIMDDKNMSTNAQNCKIITDKGVVTLRGVVDSAAERDAIAAKAGAVAGVTRVDNQLEVKVGG